MLNDDLHTINAHLKALRFLTMWRCCTAALALMLAACAQPLPLPESQSEAAAAPVNKKAGPLAWVTVEAGVPSQWRHQSFPGKRISDYRTVLHEGRPAMQAKADSAASMLRQTLYVPAAELRQLNFSWKAPALISQADMAQRDADDSPVRVVLVFEGDRSKFSMKNAMLSELAQAMTGEPMPYATLMYVWCNTRAPGSVIINPRTDRIRKLVLESGEGRLNQWIDYRRDIAADFEAAFGEAPGALLGVGIMTDSDNTRSKAQAWYGPVTLTKR